MVGYTLSELADQDLEGIAYYTTLNFGEAQARAYLASIDQSLTTIASFPLIGRVYVSKTGIQFRRFNVGEDSLFYQAENEHVFIVRVLHCNMDFDRHLDS